MDTQTIDLLFLEISQVTKTTTAKELSLLERVRDLEAMQLLDPPVRFLLERVRDLEEAMRPFAELVETTSGRIPVERLCAADWHKLAKAYRRA